MIKAIKLLGITQILMMLILSSLIVNADETGEIILEKPKLTIGQYWNYSIDIDQQINYAEADFFISGTSSIIYNEIIYNCYVLNMTIRLENSINYGTWYIDVDTNNLISYEYNTSKEYYKIHLLSLSNVIPGIPILINTQSFFQIFTPTDCYINYPIKEEVGSEYEISLSIDKNIDNRLSNVSKTFNITLKPEKAIMNISNLGLLDGTIVTQKLSTSERNISTDHSSSFFMTDETGYMPAQFVVSDIQVKITAELTDYGLTKDIDIPDNEIIDIDINSLLIVLIISAVIVIIVVYIFKFKKLKK